MKEYYACGDDFMLADDPVKPLASGTSVRMHQNESGDCAASEHG